MNRSPALACALLLLGCPAVDEPLDDDDDSAVDPAGRAVLLYGAYTGDATVATSDLEGGDVDDLLLGLAGSDWVLDASDGDPWLLGRFGSDLVRRYPGPDFAAPTLEFSTGSPSNPQALAVCAGRLFVSRMGLLQDGGGSDVAVYDPQTGAALGTIDLSDRAEGADGSSEPHAVVAHDGTIYVGLQRLDTESLVWAPDPVGQVVAIDCASQQVVDSWDTGPNPFLSAWAGDPFALLVKTDQGLQTIDPEGAGVATLYDGTIEGGDLNGAAASGDHAVFSLHWPNTARTAVRCVDRTTGDVVEQSQNSSWGLDMKAAPDGAVWAIWRDHWNTPDADEHGFARYDPATCTALGPWLQFDSEPLDVAFLP